MALNKKEKKNDNTPIFPCQKFKDCFKCMLRFLYGLSKTKPLEFQSRDIWFINNSRYASVHSLIFQRTILSGNIFVVPLHRLSEMRLPVRLSSTKTIHFSFRFTILCYDNGKRHRYFFWEFAVNLDIQSMILYYDIRKWTEGTFWASAVTNQHTGMFMLRWEIHQKQYDFNRRILLDLLVMTCCYCCNNGGSMFEYLISDGWSM